MGVRRGGALISIALASLMGCSGLGAAGTVEEWAKKNAPAGTAISCATEENGEYFFLARSGDDVRLGSRLDVTGHAAPRTSIIGWRFYDESGRSLSVKTPPRRIRSEYVPEKSKLYAETVELQKVRVDNSVSMTVSIDVKKCPSANCSRESTLEGDVSYVVKLCTISLQP
jgi:hypothetical protein